MSWYKEADGSSRVTIKKFLSMNIYDKKALAQDTDIPDVQKLFFTQEYEDKKWILEFLTQNSNLSPEIQMMFFTYDKNYTYILRWLAHNTNLSLDVQMMFFTEEYEDKNLILKNYLTENTNLFPAVKGMFFTQEYSGKDLVLQNLAQNTSFLKGLTPEQFYTLARLVKGKERLHLYKNRLDQLRGIRDEYPFVGVQ